MRHHAVKHMFGRKSGPRLALMRNLVDALVANGRIKTTIIKAKELRRHVERAITIGKGQTVHARRVLMSRFPNTNTMETIVDDLAKRFAKRAGGYTRIVKLGPRPGDNAPMAYIEFVDFKPKKAAGDETVKGDKESKKRARQHGKLVARRQKGIRKSQAAARRVSRA
jgi:large subunit ribosomal protein L17